MGNHEAIDYHGGQDPIVHLEFDLDTTVAWATASGSRWAFSLANAGAVYTEFRSSATDLSEIDWAAVAATDFRDKRIKEGKQAEFLVRRLVPWSLVNRIGVRTLQIQTQVLAAITGANHVPPVDVLPQWYF
jgi:hypothetical protein